MSQRRWCDADKRGNVAKNKLRRLDKARRYARIALNAMKDILQSLKLYLKFLYQDPACNPKVMQYVKEKIRQLEQS